MSHSWNPAPVLELVGGLSCSPCLGGPPLVSPDGHWWWNGHTWALCVQPDPDPGPEIAAAAAAPDLAKAC